MKNQTIILIASFGILCFIISGCTKESKHYDCENGRCVQSTMDAEYLTLSDCEADCQSVSTAGYNCVSGNCVTVSSLAQYPSYTACQSACGNPGSAGYKCVSGNCTYVSSGATYSTQAACQAACATNNPCIVGVWVRSICGGAYTATLTFASDGSGSFDDYDCNSLCSRYVPFTWVDHGANCTITYGSGTLCGQAFNPTGGTQAYTCSGNNLTFGNQYTRQ